MGIHAARRLPARDAADRATLVPDPEEGPLVAGAFALAADGTLPIDEVHRRATRAGLRLSKSRFHTMLRQPVYAGRIRVPAHDGEREQHVEAVHEPIVDSATWARVQERFEAPRRRGERGPSDRYPLRGLLLCPRCGKPETASTTKGRTGRYGYYWCHRCAKEGHAQRRREIVIHEAFAAHLRAVVVPPAYVAVWRELVREMARESTAAARRDAAALRSQIADETTRRARAEDLYIDGQLDRAALDRATARVDVRLADLGSRLDEVSAAADVETAAHVRFALGVTGDLPGLWARGGAEARRVLAGSIWPAGVVFDGDGFRASPPSPVIALFDGLRAENDRTPAPRGDRRPVRYAWQDAVETARPALARLYAARPLLVAASG